ncbi:hypothetical protein Tco_1166253 [Tanacetum coccineum]
MVPRANRLVIKKNNHHVASDSTITNTMLRFVVGILRHHKLYNPVSLTATVPMIYLHQFWTTINHNPNNNSFTFQLDTHTFTLNAELFRTILQITPPDTNKPYTKPPTENKILEFIKTLGYDEDPHAKITYILTFVATRLCQPWRAILSVLNRSLIGKDTSWDTARLPIIQILWGIVHSTNLDFASLTWDEFGWKIVDRSTKQTKMSKLFYTCFTKLIIDYFLSCNKNIPRRSNSKMHSEGDDLPITKLSNTVDGKFKFGMEIKNTMIDDAFKKIAGYKYYKAKKVESEKAKAIKEPKEQNVPPVRSGRGKGYMHSGKNEANVPKLFKKNDVPMKTRTLTVAEETTAAELAKSISIKEPRTQQRRRSQLTIDSQIDEDVADTYVKWGQKLKGPAVDDPAVQSLLYLRKGSKASRLESLKQKKQPDAGEGSSPAHTKYDANSETNSDVILYSSCSNTS